MSCSPIWPWSRGWNYVPRRLPKTSPSYPAVRD